VITGRLVGLSIPSNQITIRTATGDFAVPLAQVPILVNGARGSSRDLQLGQTIRIERALPTEGSTDYITQVVRVLPAANGAARTGTAAPVAAPTGTPNTGAIARTTTTGAGVVDRGTSIATTRYRAAVRTRTLGYRHTYRSHRASSRHRARRARAHARHRARRHWSRRSSVGRSSFITTAPASGGVTGVASPGTVVYPAPGVVYVTPGVVTPGTAGAGAGTIPATELPDARRQSGAASNVTPNPRIQVPTQPAGSAPSAAPGAAPGRGVPNFGTRVPARR
jgi:hypothetical protein